MTVTQLKYQITTLLDALPEPKLAVVFDLAQFLAERELQASWINAQSHNLPPIKNGLAEPMISMMRCSPMSIQRGDVILCRLPLPSAGLTQFKLRPAVVVSKDDNNQRPKFRLRRYSGTGEICVFAQMAYNASVSLTLTLGK